jgi:RNA polymerase sigma-70 factor, ECF subfamily
VTPNTDDEKAERAAIALLKHGNVHGLGTLVQLHQLRAVRTAYLIVGNRPAAEDVAADAFVSAYEHIRQYDERRPFAPWFFRIVVNGALKHLRKSRRLVTLEGEIDWMQDDAPQPDAFAALRESRAAVMAAVRTLSNEQRAVVVLRFYLDMDERETAETLKVPLGTVKWRLFSAKQKLKKLLSDPKSKLDLKGQWEA